MPKRRTRVIPNGMYHGEGVFGDIASLLKRTGNKLVHAITLPFKRSKPAVATNPYSGNIIKAPEPIPQWIKDENIRLSSLPSPLPTKPPPIPALPRSSNSFLDDIKKKPALRSVAPIPRKVVASSPQDFLRNNPKFQTLASQRIDTNDDDEYEGEGRRRRKVMRPFDFKLPIEKYKKRNRLHRTKPVKKTASDNEMMKQLLHLLSFSKKEGGRRRKMV